MMIQNRITFFIGKWYTALLKDIYRPARMSIMTDFPAIQTCLAKVMTEGHENQTLAWNAGEIVLKHTVKHFEGMHHQALLALVMRVASCSCTLAATCHHGAAAHIPLVEIDGGEVTHLAQAHGI